MCSAPDIPSPPPPPAPVQPSEALKTVSADQAAARDNTLRRMAQRLSLQQTNATSPLGLTSAASTQRKALLGS